MKGKISQWNDEKGFGFITGQKRNERIFFHISSITTRSRRPEVGDLVTFNVIKDKDNRLKASSVSIEGLSKSKGNSNAKIEPPKYNLFDYLLILVIMGSLGYTGFAFYKANIIERVWPYIIPAVIAFFVLSRQKTPPQEHYSCTKCKAVERFNPRTVEAWSRGITKLFCNKCHYEWIKNNPRPQKSYVGSSKPSGCLGSFLIIAALPIIGGVSIYQWLV